MIPIKITIEGLYSYKERQTIDFSKLIENHLFGIFGDVGSGKSSILDAMLFAVYGKNDRLGNSGGFLYNMMNLQSDKLFLEFDCWAGPQNANRYRFLYEARRNSKRFEDVNKKRKVISIFQHGQWEPSDELVPEQIMGMSSDNFRRTIIIPQGKFREFLELTGGQRTAMMQELFPLERFDLSDKTKRLKGQNHDAILETETLLSELKEATPERLKTLEENLSEQQTAFQSLEKHVTEAQQIFQQMQQTQQLFQEKAAAEKSLEALQAKKGEFAHRQQQLKQYREAIANFKDKIAQFKDLQNEAARLDSNLHRMASEKNQLQQKLDAVKADLEQKEKAYQEREKTQQQCEDLEKVMSLKGLEGQLADLEGMLAKHQTDLKKAQEEENSTKKGISEAEGQMKTLRVEASQMADLGELLHWKSKELDLTKEIEKAETRVDSLQSNMENALANWKSALTQKAGEQFFRDQWPHCHAALEAEKQRLTDEKALLDKEWQEVGNQQAFAQHLDLLEEGKPCPLCGATHHPHPADKTEADAFLQELEQKRRSNTEKLERLGQWLNQLAGLQQQHRAWEEQRTEWAETAKKAGDALTAHRATWQWEGQEQVGLEVLRTKKAQQEQVKKSIEQLENKLEALKQAFEKQQQAVKALEAINQEKAVAIGSLKAKAESIQESLHHLEFAQYTHYPLENLKSSIRKGKERIERAEQEFKESQEAVSELEKQLSEKAGALKSQQENLAQLRQKEKVAQDALNKQVDESSFNGLHEVKDLLQTELDLEKEEQAIEAYQKQATEGKAKLREIEVKIGGRTYEQEVFVAQTQQLAQLENEKKEKLQEIAVTEKYIGETEKNLAKRRELEARLRKLQLRDENIKTLTSLFKGKGFVNYISGVYLENLVKAADKRFIQLTRNNLSLRLNSDQEFTIADQLNGGKERLLKTLSGGQTFQAALCLALALAENVKSLNQSERSFFFLDEGFGTLDRKSLAVVFETLRALQKEDRIVGIISHVDELQQEIPVALHIHFDQEQGSRVSYSWEG